MLSAAVVCSNPWNLETSNIALQRTWLGSEVYSKTMGTSMKRLFEELDLLVLFIATCLANNRTVTSMRYHRTPVLTSRGSGT